MMTTLALNTLFDDCSLFQWSTENPVQPFNSVHAETLWVSEHRVGELPSQTELREEDT